MRAVSVLVLALALVLALVLALAVARVQVMAHVSPELSVWLPRIRALKRAHPV